MKIEAIRLLKLNLYIDTGLLVILKSLKVDLRKLS